MIKLKIIYNPYYMRTSIEIDEQDIKTSEYYNRILKFAEQEIPLQSWIDPMEFQDGWKGLLWETIGDSDEVKVEVSFKGREIDFLDLKKSLERQSRSGKYKVDVSFPENKQKLIWSDKNVLENVKKAYESIHNRKFANILEDKLFNVEKDSTLWKAYNDLEKNYNEAMDNEFSIVFSGMYSSGKSTIINAILGKNILPTTDDTCTSKVFKIQHDPKVEFAKMSCVDEHGNIVVQEEEYKEEELKEKFESIFPKGEKGKLLPSRPSNIDTVLISANMQRLYPESVSYNDEDMKIVIIDTPGTNSGTGNSVDDGVAHCEITKKVMISDKKEIVILVSNATDYEADSVQDYLDMIDSCGSQGSYDQRFMFILNKADNRNWKDGESWTKVLENVHEYYTKTKNGGKRVIQNPRVFPMCASGAYEIRSDHEDNYGSIRERYYKTTMVEGNLQFLDNPKKVNYHFDEWCSTSETIKAEIKNRIEQIKNSNINDYEKIKQEIELHSGVVSLEMAICDYIERYAFPLKIQDLLKTFVTIFKETEQLVDIAKKKLDYEKEILDKDKGIKDSEVKNKQREQEEQEMLKDVSERVKEAKRKVEEIEQNFNKAAEEKIGEVKECLEDAIYEAIDKGKKNKTNKNIMDEIKKDIGSATKKSEEIINEQYLDTCKDLKNLEKNLKKFFSEIKDIADFGIDFNIDNIVAFKKISDECLDEVRVVPHMIPNPKLKKGGFFLFRIFNIFRSQEVQDGNEINVDDLEYQLNKIRSEYSVNLDKYKGEVTEKLNEASENLKRRLDLLEGLIRKYKEKIRQLDDEIKKISKNVDDRQKITDQLTGYSEYLGDVRKKTQVINGDEMEW